MDDNVITLDVDESPARRAIDRANAGLDSIEQHAAKAGSAISSGISTGMDAALRMAERFAAQVDRGFSAIERMAVSAANSIGSAAGAIGGMVLRLAEMAAGIGIGVEAWRVLRSHIQGTATDVSGHA